MARALIGYGTLTASAETEPVASCTLNPDDGMYLDPGEKGILNRIFFRVTMDANGSAKTLTFKAGDDPPAVRNGLGDYAVAIAASTTRYLGPFESARFVQNDGTILLDIESSGDGTIEAYLVPIA